MCGIAGFQGKGDVSFRDVLRHRGPDAYGNYSDGDTHLYHWRLSIIDLTEAGGQPIPNEDGTVRLIYNGEIYNFLELREALKEKGHSFRGSSDGEVLVHLYEEHGEDMLGMLRGMFSFALYDKKQGSIFLARDPFGVKPLVYSELPRGFVFASELRALSEIDGFPREMDFDSLGLYFRLNYIPAPKTIWKNARKLMPGSYIVVKGGRVVKEACYADFSRRVFKGGGGEAAETVEAALGESVRAHLVSDVPVGAFLSGGIDSSLVALFAQRAMGTPLKTFTVAFPEFPYYSESALARTTANALGTEHTEIPVTLNEAKDTLFEMLEHMDEPFADSSIVPAAIVSKATAKCVKVALSGDGGDELFAGYNKYQGLALAKALRPLAPLIRGISGLPLPERRGSLPGDRVRQLRKLARTIEKDPVMRALRAMEVFTLKQLQVLMVGRRVDDSLYGMLERLFGEAASCGYGGLDSVLYVDSRFVLPYDMLHKIDTASMRYSLEVRVPFVDAVVAGAAFSLPEKFKLRGLKRKWILRKVAEKYLPPAILRGPKKGFGIPIGEWIRKDLYGVFADELSKERVEKSGFINPQYVKNLFEEHMSLKRDRFWELWSLFVLLRWKEKNAAG